MTTYTYALDTTGTLPANKITNELHVVTAANSRDFYCIVPKLGPFFENGLIVEYQDQQGSVRQLVKNVDYYPSNIFLSASRACAKQVWGSITLLDNSLVGVVKLKQYQSIGGEWVLDTNTWTALLANITANPRITTWEQLTGVPNIFPPVDHPLDLVDMVGMTDTVDAIRSIEQAILQSGGSMSTLLRAHLLNLDNPHGTTKTHVGLGSVQNYGVATIDEVRNGAAGKYVTASVLRQRLLDLLDGFNQTLAGYDQAANDKIALAVDAAIPDFASLVDDWNLARTSGIYYGIGSANAPTPTGTYIGEVIALSANSATQIVYQNDTTVAANSQMFRRHKINDAWSAWYKLSVTQSENDLRYQSKLSFNPVQSGTGVGQQSNIVKIGWSGTRLKATVDSNDLGNIVTDTDADAKYAPIPGTVNPFVGTAKGIDLYTIAYGDRGSFVAKTTGLDFGYTNAAGISFNHEGARTSTCMGLTGDGYLCITMPVVKNTLTNYGHIAWQLAPNGNVITTGDVSGYSDRRLKENLRPIISSVAKIKKLGGWHFTWKDVPVISSKSGVADIGLIADEVEAEFPEAVGEGMAYKGVQYKTVAYDKLVPVLIEAIKELDKRIESLEKANDGNTWALLRRFVASIFVSSRALK